VLAQGKEVLSKVASVLAGSTEMIRVEGHTDDVPIGPVLQAKYASNWELSAARASSVVRHFETIAGIDPARLEAVGRSMYSPVAPNDSPEGRQKNRRVELVLVAAR
jgi:chemotaxis protein MotB